MNIVVGVADTPAGLAALRYAVAQARGRGMPLQAVRAWAAPYYRDAAGTRMRAEIEQEARAALRTAFTTTLGGFPHDIDLEIVVREGFAGQVLVACAEQDSDLLVLGGRVRGRRPRRVGGPVIRHCLRHAGCPVVVVPPSPLTDVLRPRRLAREIDRELRHLA
jgi:nucleotide-binding universal stress UspA family protein